MPCCLWIEGDWSVSNATWTEIKGSLHISVLSWIFRASELQITGIHLIRYCIFMTNNRMEPCRQDHSKKWARTFSSFLSSQDMLDTCSGYTPRFQLVWLSVASTKWPFIPITFRSKICEERTISHSNARSIGFGLQYGVQDFPHLQWSMNLLLMNQTGNALDMKLDVIGFSKLLEVVS